MEWCRMYVLKIVVWFVLQGLSISELDMKLTGKNSVSETEQKRQNLLRSLRAYTPERHPDLPVVKNMSQSLDGSTNLPFPGLVESQSPTPSGESDAISDPSDETIRSYQDFYRVMYGSQEGINLLRKQYGPTGLQRARAKYAGVKRGMDDVRQANNHFLRIRNRARCRLPVPQVVRVKDYYPDISREYLPRCTLLHRCGDTTGCCDSDAFHCVPSAIQEVTLHFYTLTVSQNGLVSKGNSIEKLLFQNHTACECQPINDLPRIQSAPHHPLDGEEPPLPKSKCRDCPVPFTNRIYKDGRCGCDCFDRQKPCIRIKRGREPLSSIEQRCVEAHHCHIPDCEYGLYNYDTGYCPKRHDEEARNPPRRPSSSHRWSFIERD